MKRTIVLSLVLASALSAHAAQQPAQQPAQPPAGSNWQHVQALPIGASINVKARTSHTGCTLKSVDADTLTCSHGKDIAFQRADILTIQISRRGRSALIGLEIGGGAGAAIGYATSSSCSPGELCILPRGGVAAFNGVLFGIAGAITGGLTDFTKSTVYRAP